MGAYRTARKTQRSGIPDTIILDRLENMGSKPNSPEATTFEKNGKPRSQPGSPRTTQISNGYSPEQTPQTVASPSPKTAPSSPEQFNFSGTGLSSPSEPEGDALEDMPEMLAKLEKPSS